MPRGPLIEGRDGLLYGTTEFGGSNDVGTVFKLNKDGGAYELLHIFVTNSVDGRNPRASLLLGRDGTLYGTTINGGSYRVGAIFKVQTDGSGYDILRHFSTTAGDGRNPYGPLVGVCEGLDDPCLVFVFGLGGSSHITAYIVS